MPYAESDGVKIYYEIKGEGEPLVFLHGFGLNRKMWQYQIDYFSQKYMTIAIDARGHGKSDSPVTDHAREHRVSDTLNVINHAKLDRVHLIGLSMGGGDALSLAIDHPDRLLSLTLAGTVAAGWKASKRYKDYSDIAKSDGVDRARVIFRKMVTSYYESRNKELKERLAAIVDEFNGIYWLDPMKGKYKVRDDLLLVHNINTPTLIIIGQNDIFFRPLAEKLTADIAGAGLEVIKDSGHMVNMEKPKEFNRVLESFLNSLDRE